MRIILLCLLNWSRPPIGSSNQIRLAVEGEKFDPLFICTDAE